LDALRVPSSLRGLHIRRSNPGEAALLADISRREINPGTATPEVVRRVMDFSTELWFTFERAGAAPAESEVVGYHAGLLLNARGLGHLLAGQFNFLCPDLGLLCGAGDLPWAILSWSTVARSGLNSVALPMIMERLKEPRYRHLDCYARGATTLGVRMMIRLG